MTPTYLTSTGSSIRQLRAAAENYGLYAEAMENLTLSQLQKLKGSAILHVKSASGDKNYDHFMLFLGSASDGYWVLDPPFAPKVISRARLSALWDGRALIVSRVPIKVSRVGLLLSVGVIPWPIAAAAVVMFIALSRVIRRPNRAVTLRGGLALVGGRLLVLAGVPFIFSATYHGLMPQGLFQDSRLLEEIQEGHASGFIPKIGRKEFDRLVRENGVTLIDARMPADFQRAHLPAALNIPVSLTADELRARSRGIPEDKGVVVYCQSDSCPFAGRVAFRLRELGFSDVRVFPGGWREWSKTTPRS